MHIVSKSNPAITITNSDLELVGTVAQVDILSNETSVAYLTTCTFTNNTSDLYWHGKGSNTTAGPDAYLLQVSALHQSHYCHKSDTHFIPGSRNLMDDDFSRKWNITDDELLTYFSIKYI